MRRGILLLILSALALCAQQALPRPEAPPPPLVQPKVADKVEDRWTPAAYEAQTLGGLLAQRMRVNLEQRLLHIEEDALLAGFIKRPGSHPWIGEHVGKYLHAAVNTERFTKNEALKRQMMRMALELIKQQKPDGYLGTYTDDQRWTSWDVWVHKYNLIGLLEYYKLTGDERALRACARIGDLLYRTFVTEGRDIIASSTHVGMAASSVLEPVCDLYRYTGDKKHLLLAEHIVKSWENPNGPKIISSLMSHGSVFRTANGKAYEMMSDLVGLLELYRLTGNKEYFEAARRAQQDIMLRRRFITGTTSNGEHFHEDYLLPGEQANDVGEGCATVTWLQLNWHLLRLTGDIKYADEIERTVFNQLLAAQDPKTGNICYFTPLNGRKTPTTNINCCRSSEPRGISMIPQLVWGRQGDIVKILMYAPGEVRFDDVVITSETDFPETGKIRLLIKPLEPGKRIPLYLRVPSWTKRFSVTNGGRPLTGKPGEYLVIDRTWSTQDRVEIDMDVTVNVEDDGKSYPDSVAIRRGPQYMALESFLNPDVRYLFRTGLASLTAADGRSVPGVTFNGHGRQEVTLHLVPFMDAQDYRIWIAKQGKVSTAAISRSAFGREIYSSRDTASQGSIVDERTDTWTSTNPARVKPDALDWFGVELREPGRINRVVFVNGPVTLEGGQFDVSKGKPYIEVQRELKGPWEKVATLGSYEGKAGEVVDVKLPREVGAVAVRVAGYPAGKFTTCAELSAYE